MELALLNLFALLRPILFIDVRVKLFGLSLFDTAAIGLFAILLAALIFHAALRRTATLTGLDLLILAFVFWCVSVLVIYPDKSNIKDVVKLVIPFLTYIVARNVIPDQAAYRRTLFLLILGFLPPLLLSVWLIAMGQGIGYVSYWTKLARYAGAYTGAHNMSHNMAFLLMAITLYVGLERLQHQGETWVIGIRRKTLFAGMIGLSLICLYGASVRTTVVGLLVFFGIYIFVFQRKRLVLWAAILAAVGVVSAPIIVPRFFNDATMVASGKWEASKLGSNRPNIWSNNIEFYLGLPLDRKIAGVGIGNNLDVRGHAAEGGAPAAISLSAEEELENVRDSHNDYLDIFMQTGVVGFVLFMGIQILLFQSIRRLPAEERYLFLAFFLAVSVMNFVSNSYVSRFGLGQMFYLVMAYVGLRRR